MLLAVALVAVGWLQAALSLDLPCSDALLRDKRALRPAPAAQLTNASRAKAKRTQFGRSLPETHPVVGSLLASPKLIFVNFNIVLIGQPDIDNDELMVKLAYEFNWRTTEVRQRVEERGSGKFVFSNTTTELKHAPGPIYVYRDQSLHHDYVGQSHFWTLDVRDNGIARMITVMTHKIECGFNMRHFPFDQHVCTLYMASSSPEVVLDWNRWTEKGEPKPPVVLAKNHGLHHFYVDIPIHYDQCDIAQEWGVTCLAARIHMRRHYLYYFISVLLPSTCIVIISFLSFWIEPNAVPARATLGVTSILSMITLIVKEVSNHGYFSALDIWLLVHLVFSVVSLIEFGLVNYFYTAHLDAQRKGTPGASTSHRSRRGMLTDQVARILMPVLYTLFIVVFFIVIVSKGHSKPMSDTEYVTEPYG